jgi:glycosyltransferase involved in cell wall biosynthesis
MRVLQFGRFWNNQHGGIERHVALLSRELATHGLDVVNLVAADNPQGSNGIVDGYRLVQAPSYGRVMSTAISPALIAKALSLHREDKFDIAHIHLPDPLSHLVSMMLPASVKQVVTWHSDIVRQKRLLALYLPLLRRLAYRADALVAATEAHFSSSSQIPPNIPPNRLHVIPYGLDFDALELTPVTKALCHQIKARSAGKAIIFALGRHVYYKGFDVLLDAMRQVDGLLILGGDGPLRGELEALAAQGEGLESKVWFTGRIPEDDLPAYFHACDMFCLPSVEQSEAFALVQLEAMGCGKPVVCTQLNNGVNIVNVAGETGLAVPPRDATALAAAINELIKDTLFCKRLGIQARQRAHTHYSLRVMGEKHLELYRALLSS